MSLFKAQEELASVYHINDVDSTKKGSYPETADFTILMNIIKVNAELVAIMGQEMGDYVANVDNLYTGASSIVKGDKIVWEGGTYIVENKPKYNRLFNRYKIILKRDK